MVVRDKPAAREVLVVPGVPTVRGLPVVVDVPGVRVIPEVWELPVVVGIPEVRGYRSGLCAPGGWPDAYIRLNHVLTAPLGFGESADLSNMVRRSGHPQIGSCWFSPAGLSVPTFCVKTLKSISVHKIKTLPMKGTIKYTLTMLSLVTKRIMPQEWLVNEQFTLIRSSITNSKGPNTHYRF